MKQYNSPQISIVELSSDDVMVTQSMGGFGETGSTGGHDNIIINARNRRNRHDDFYEDDSEFESEI